MEKTNKFLTRLNGLIRSIKDYPDRYQNIIDLINLYDEADQYLVKIRRENNLLPWEQLQLFVDTMEKSLVITQQLVQPEFYDRILKHQLDLPCPECTQDNCSACLGVDLNLSIQDFRQRAQNILTYVTHEPNNYPIALLLLDQMDHFALHNRINNESKLLASALIIQVKNRLKEVLPPAVWTQLMEQCEKRRITQEDNLQPCQKEKVGKLPLLHK